MLTISLFLNISLRELVIWRHLYLEKDFKQDFYQKVS